MSPGVAGLSDEANFFVFDKIAYVV